MTKSTASVRAIKNATASIRSTRPEPKAAKPAAKKTVAAEAVEQVVPPTNDVPESEDEVLGSWRDLMDGFKMPSGRRMAVSVVTQMLVLGTGVYSGFQLGALLAFGAAVLTGSAFLSFLAWFVVTALSVYTSLIAAARVGTIAKLDALVEMTFEGEDHTPDEIADAKKLVAAQQNERMAEATKRKLRFGVIDGSVPQTQRDALVTQYQLGRLDCLFAHPKSAAHGLTLTKGTSTIWVSPTADAELFEQGSKRQYRIGQTQKTEVLTILGKDTQDERVYNEILVPKQKRMTNLLDLFALA